jgi:hypothetical protein
MKERQNMGEDLYEPDGGHPSTLGHQRIAEFLHAKMAELGLVPAPKEAHAPAPAKEEKKAEESEKQKQAET